MMFYAIYLILFVVLCVLVYGMALFFLKCLSCARDPCERSAQEREIEEEYMMHALWRTVLSTADWIRRIVIKNKAFVAFGAKTGIFIL